jgi:NADPH:quinone reductase-like Zn-dependent oxidoreductase
MVGARFPLEKASEAHRLLNRRGVTGKIVLDC